MINKSSGLIARAGHVETSGVSPNDDAAYDNNIVVDCKLQDASTAITSRITDSLLACTTTLSQVSASTTVSTAESRMDSADIVAAPESSADSNDLSNVLSVIEAVAAIASICVAITIYKLTMRSRQTNVDVEMNDFSRASTALTTDPASGARPDPAATLPIPPTPYVRLDQNQ